MKRQTARTIIFVVTLLIMFAWYIGYNAITAGEWNDGTCSDCGERYELCAVTRDYRKYYSCPVCGKEVTRY